MKHLVKSIFFYISHFTNILRFLPNLQRDPSKFPADLVTFTEKILNGKLQLLCSEQRFFAVATLKVCESFLFR